MFNASIHVGNTTFRCFWSSNDDGSETCFVDDRCGNISLLIRNGWKLLGYCGSVPMFKAPW